MGAIVIIPMFLDDPYTANPTIVMRPLAWSRKHALSKGQSSQPASLFPAICRILVEPLRNSGTRNEHSKVVEQKYNARD
jgi:hypothetical protein